MVNELNFLKSGSDESSGETWKKKKIWEDKYKNEERKKNIIHFCSHVQHPTTTHIVGLIKNILHVKIISELCIIYLLKF